MFQWLKTLFQDRTFGAIRNSAWPKLRDWYFRKNPFCEVCGKRAKEIHHIVPVHIDNSKELEISNLISLCRRHHFEIGHFFNFRSYNKDIKEWVDKIKNKP